MIRRESICSDGHWSNWDNNICSVLCDRCSAELGEEVHYSDEYSRYEDHPDRKVCLCNRCRQELILNWYTANDIRLGLNPFEYEPEYKFQ